MRCLGRIFCDRRIVCFNSFFVGYSFSGFCFSRGDVDYVFMVLG